ncbi:MAG: LptF/LptG family permease [Oligoflexia bacterium]|nr:LptF/LptG family permease [Oligoflexia bacterium]MBF0365170.1 LptF/LptG family permease [Oligoflexia bacterium]
MNTILSRLILKEWITSFLGSCLIFVFLVSIANIVSEVLRAVTTLQDVLLNHILTLPMWLGKIFPVSAMTATLFSLNKLQRRNELIAIFACGHSRFAFFGTLTYAAIFVSLLQLFTNSVVRPYAERQKKEWLRDGGIHFRKHDKTPTVKTSSGGNGRVWYRNDSYYCAFTAFDKARAELRDVTLFYYGPDYKLTEITWADRVTYQSGNTWLLTAGETLYSLQNKNFSTSKNFLFQKATLLERPSDFRDLDSEISELTLIKLYRYILKIKRLGINSAEYEAILYERIASALICLIFPFIATGAIFNPNRRQSSFGKSVVFVLVFTGIFWLAYSACMALASSHKLPPLAAVMAIPAGCILYLLLMFYRHRKIS